MTLPEPQALITHPRDRGQHGFGAGPKERLALRQLVLAPEHDTRAELVRKLIGVDGIPAEAEVLEEIRPSCTAALGQIIDAVVSYERFAALVNAAFRTLCSVSHSMGAQPLTPQLVQAHSTIVRCARELPDHYQQAAERMVTISADHDLENKLGEFAIRRTPVGLAELLLGHHEQVQAAKGPDGKRPWFEPVRQGWVIRPPYGTAEQLQPDGSFVHPVRIAPLQRFLSDTAT